MLRIMIITIGLALGATACGPVAPIDRDHWDSPVVGHDGGVDNGSN